MEKNVFEYIKTEENNFKIVRIPITGSKDWNMHEHIERCTNVANAWFHTGKNDGLRPYDDIVTPIINVGFRSEGFDVKDIIPFVNDADDYYKSFLVKKFHPQWARNNQLDTFIDDVVETSIIYDLVLIKDVDEVRPEVVDLKTLAFCDQTDVLSGPICIKHYYTPGDLLEKKGVWDEQGIKASLYQSQQSKKVSTANDQEAQTPGKYIEVYELRGHLPESWIVDGGDPLKYVPQMHIVTFYRSENGTKEGISLYKGKDKKLTDTFKALKIDRIRSKGRACGRSVVESLFEPQVWNNYSAIKMKKLLDAAITVFQTDSEELANQKLTELKDNTILKHETGKPLTKVDGSLQNMPHFQNYQTKQENSARIIGSASDAQLGTNPVSGTPFALQNLVVQQGQGLHEYRQGKIASFFADTLYPELILKYIVKEINSSVKFSEELTLEELSDIADIITNNVINDRIKAKILETGNVPTEEEKQLMMSTFRDDFLKKGSRRFFETVKDELNEIPLEVMVNISGKQRYMAQNADKITNIIREILKNPQAFATTPGIGKAVNQLLEESGMSPIDFRQLTEAPKAPEPQEAPVTTG